MQFQGRYESHMIPLWQLKRSSGLLAQLGASGAQVDFTADGGVTVNGAPVKLFEMCATEAEKKQLLKAYLETEDELLAEEAAQELLGAETSAVGAQLESELHAPETVLQEMMADGEMQAKKKRKQKAVEVEEVGEKKMKKRGRPPGTKKLRMQGDGAEGEEMDEPEETETKGEKRGLANDLSTFVPLPALLPPLPQKGDFRVEAIKASRYFFS